MRKQLEARGSLIEVSSYKLQATSCFSDYLRDSIIISVYSTYRVVVSTTYLQLVA